MSDITLRPATVDDGLAVHKLVVDTGVLDENSVYAYCAVFRHFPGASVVACRGDDIVGFVMGHPLPERPDHYFLWQVGVSEAARGVGLATRLLGWVVDNVSGTRFIETTITPDNTASRRLFRGFAAKRSTDIASSPGLSAAQLGPGHLPEELFLLGPFDRSTT